MKPWETLSRARMPDGGELTLVRHPSEVAILLDGDRLMTSRMHGSEDALAVLGCERARTEARPRVLIGGLGMGYTVRAALNVLPPAAVVVVAELVPAIVEWNRGAVADLAGRPLDDPRVQVEIGDVVAIIRGSSGAFDSVMLDVDNGPEALTAAPNASLYDDRGIAAIRRSLRPGGTLAVWAIRDDVRFERRLRSAGFTVRRTHVPSRPTRRRGLKHTVLLAYV
jgi:spermidine synthase